MATDHGKAHLILRIDLDADPITGSLGVADGARRRFCGWIALAAALEAIRAELAPTASIQSRDRDDGAR